MKNASLPIKYWGTVGLVFLAFVLYSLGASGSISGYILCASLPYILFDRLSSKDEIVNLMFSPLKLASVLLILGGAVLFYNVKDQLTNFTLLGKFFINSSINYVSLIFYGFSMLYVIFYEVLKERSGGKVSTLDFFIGFFLLCSGVFYSALYLTRSTLIVLIVMLLIYIREYRKIILMLGLIGVIYSGAILIDYFLVIIGPSANNTKDLVVPSNRIESMLFLIRSAVNFNYDFSKTMSNSSLINLLFSLFPFTLVFIIDILFAGISIPFQRGINKSIIYLILLLLALIVCYYQMDFFSIFVLFLLIQVISFKKSIRVLKRLPNTA
ncbi:hypothetical protein KZP23_21745 [Echinicola marina]|uniref:hypothetical protein n=1 Tax=Echinicola marina TaxID=2859768 RepID=UPI001CF70F21|nr:hypothetical protein [Echinicola marina]UCS93241.1 hypothetical protein KZP23_21745 [Echinicola marina]